jgi:uncharacterized protein with GYD domain
MATYVTIIKLTERGTTSFKDTGKRATAFKAAAEKMGGKVTNLFWTLGAFDGVLVFEAADDEMATALMLRLGAQGFVQTQTARAFTAAEMDRILATAAM